MFNNEQIVTHQWYGEERNTVATNLSHGSKIQVDVVCDYCGNTIKRSYNTQLKLMKINGENNDCCSKCRGIKIGKTQTFTIEKVVSIFSEEGCMLLSKEYIAAKSKLRYIAKCGCISEITLDKFRTGHGRLCVKCRSIINGYNLRNTVESVSGYFEINGCKVTSMNYTTNESKINYIAQCGHSHSISFSNFKDGKGRQCPACYIESISGENSDRWDHSKSNEDRVIQRKVEGYSDWKLSVFKRDNRTCKCCGDTKQTINAHHIQNYSSNPTLRTDINNGVTLCYSCHTAFHKIYGSKMNTKEQLMEFYEYNKEYHVSLKGA